MKELVKEFNLITDKILLLLKEEKEEEIDVYIEKREEILEKIKVLNDNKAFKTIATELNILEKEKELKEKMETRKVFVKNELLKIHQRKNVNNSYIKNSNYTNFFTTKV